MLNYRQALTAFEIALRRQMEVAAAELRALPAGCEVPEDYSFDCIGADSAPSTVRLSELLRGASRPRARQSPVTMNPTACVFLDIAERLDT
jgi:predicted dithiol-disulfide oxidoreductase (DUF899 family)